MAHTFLRAVSEERMKPAALVFVDSTSHSSAGSQLAVVAATTEASVTSGGLACGGGDDTVRLSSLAGCSWWCRPWWAGAAMSRRSSGAFLTTEASVSLVAHLVGVPVHGAGLRWPGSRGRAGGQYRTQRAR